MPTTLPRFAFLDANTTLHVRCRHQPLWKPAPLLLWTIIVTLSLARPGCVSGDDDAAKPTPTTRVLLWSDQAPNGDGTCEKGGREMKVFLPAAGRANGAAVVICPGGGYIRHVTDRKGYPIANWLNTNGIAAIILEFRS